MHKAFETLRLTLKTMPAMVVPVFIGVGNVIPDLLSNSFLREKI